MICQYDVALGDNDVEIVADACAIKLHRWRFLIVHPRNFSINCIISHSHHHRQREAKIISDHSKRLQAAISGQCQSIGVKTNCKSSSGSEAATANVGNHKFSWQIADKYDQQIHLFSFTFLWLAGNFKFDLKF